MLPFVASAYDAEIDGIYYNFSGDEAMVTYKNTSDNSYSGAVVIPASITYNDKTYSVTSIGDRAFLYCNSLTSVSISSGVTSIGYYAFDGCKGLTSVNIGNSVTSIRDYAFYGCSSLTSINIPNSVTSIGEYAFEKCSGLTSVNIGNSVTSIGRCAFLGCSSLTSVTIPKSVTSIGYNAFQDCSSLTSVTIGSGLTNIGSSAFSKCSALTDFYCYADNVPSTLYTAFSYSPIESATLHVPALALDAYNTTAPWSGFGSIVAITQDDTDGIEGPTPNPSLVERGAWCDLSGRRVQQPRNGIFIKNGKKILMK